MLEKIRRRNLSLAITLCFKRSERLPGAGGVRLVHHDGNAQFLSALRGGDDIDARIAEGGINFTRDAGHVLHPLAEDRYDLDVAAVESQIGQLSADQAADGLFRRGGILPLDRETDAELRERLRDEVDIDIHFETSEIKELVCELRKTAEKNWERIRTNPSQNHYNGPNLIIRVFFKNLMGQWCESSISYEIAWLAYKNPPQHKKHNLNENTIPPKEIHEGDKFKAVLSSNRIAPFVFEMTNEEYVTDLLQKYIDESPWLSTVLKEKYT